MNAAGSLRGVKRSWVPLGLTPRQEEVFSREPGPRALAQLMIERPGHAPDICVVCWRDLGFNASVFSTAIACTRRAGSKTPACQVYIRKCNEVGERAREVAKASLVPLSTHDSESTPGKHRWGSAGAMPPALFIELESLASASELGRRWGVNHKTITWWRLKLFPSHPRNGRKGRLPASELHEGGMSILRNLGTASHTPGLQTSANRGG